MAKTAKVRTASTFSNETGSHVRELRNNSYAKLSEFICSIGAGTPRLIELFSGGAVTQTVVLQRLGGVGKTQLTIEYASAIAKRYSG